MRLANRKHVEASICATGFLETSDRNLVRLGAKAIVIAILLSGLAVHALAQSGAYSNMGEYQVPTPRSAGNGMIVKKASPQLCPSNLIRNWVSIAGSKTSCINSI